MRERTGRRISVSGFMEGITVVHMFIGVAIKILRGFFLILSCSFFAPFLHHLIFYTLLLPLNSIRLALLLPCICVS